MRAAKATAQSRFRDLKAKKNPKGGAPAIVNAPQLDLNNLIAGSSTGGTGGGGGKGVSLGSFSIQKATDSSSAPLFQKAT